MNPLAIVAAINASLALVESLMPVLESLKLSGQITAEQQQSVLSKYQETKTNLDAKFSGPEWEVAP